MKELQVGHAYSIKSKHRFTRERIYLGYFDTCEKHIFIRDDLEIDYSVDIEEDIINLLSENNSKIGRNIKGTIDLQLPLSEDDSESLYYFITKNPYMLYMNKPNKFFKELLNFSYNQEGYYYAVLRFLNKEKELTVSEEQLSKLIENTFFVSELEMVMSDVTILNYVSFISDSYSLARALWYINNLADLTIITPEFFKKTYLAHENANELIDDLITSDGSVIDTLSINDEYEKTFK